MKKNKLIADVAERNIYHVQDNGKFKEENLLNWYDNTDFWLQSKMRHLQDVWDFTGNQIEEMIRMQKRLHPTIVDFGCGEGWILRLLCQRKMQVEYIGLDFNKKFIDYLKDKYKEQKSVDFACMDFEVAPPPAFIAKADIGINFFNFFEIPDIETAFRNVASMLKPNSYFMIANIDPVMQILSISKAEGDFLKNLRLYEKYGTRLGYDKDIDIGDLKSDRIYRSLLYSTDTYVKLAKSNGLQLIDYKEVVKTGNIVPQIYQYIFFHKP